MVTLWVDEDAEERVNRPSEQTGMVVLGKCSQGQGEVCAR